MILRDTRGADLSSIERFNFFPASPLCCVTWVFEGDIHSIELPEHMECPSAGRTWPKFAFSGAQAGPLVSWNPGETFVITVAFYPDAFFAMTGIDLHPFAGRMEPALDVLPPAILEPCRAFTADVEHVGAERAFLALQDEIEALWSKARPEGIGPIRWLQDWSRSLVLRAALSGPGRSTRQIARRVKSWTGMSERDLRGLGHSEQLYSKMHEAVQAGELDWAEIAAESGYADQAHMIKRLRQHTGFTPEQLRQRAQNDEALWAYRLLGQYFSKP